MVENKTVETISTTNTAETQDKLRLNAKNRKIAIHKNKELRNKENKIKLRVRAIISNKEGDFKLDNLVKIKIRLKF
jgi:hypothetical protein